MQQHIGVIPVNPEFLTNAGKRVALVCQIEDSPIPEIETDQFSQTLENSPGKFATELDLAVIDGLADRIDARFSPPATPFDMLKYPSPQDRMSPSCETGMYIELAVGMQNIHRRVLSNIAGGLVIPYHSTGQYAETSQQHLKHLFPGGFITALCCLK